MAGFGSDSPDALEENSRSYRPISRIKLACLSCRNRKIRCNGEKPACKSCRRAGHESSRVNRAEGQRTDHQEFGTVLQEIHSRFSRLENQISGLEAFLKDFVSKDSGHTTSDVSCHRPHPPSPGDVNQHAGDTSNATRPSRKRKRQGSCHGEACSSVPRNPDTLEEESENVVAVAGMSSPQVVLDTVEAYFTYCHHQPYSFFHKQSFMERLGKRGIPDHLLYAVLANAVRYSSNPFYAGRSHETAVTYVQQSWRSIIARYLSVHRHPDISVVQSVALISIFDFTGALDLPLQMAPGADVGTTKAGKARHDSAWLKVGIAIRMAQDLRMMMEPDSDLTEIEKEEHRRVFWSIYILDRLVSCGRARPPTVHDGSCHLQLPMDELTYKQGKGRKYPTLEQVSALATVNPIICDSFSNEVVTAGTLGKIASHMLQNIHIGKPSPPWDANSGHAALQSELLYLETFLRISEPIATYIFESHTPDGKIDHAEIGPVVFARALYHLCYALLNHPFLLRRNIRQFSAAPSSFLTRAFASGWEHARQIIVLLRETRSAGCFIRNSFYGYITLVAATILALHSYCDEVAIAEESNILLQESIFIMDDIAKFWKNVYAMATGLKKFAADSSNFRLLCSSSSTVGELSSEDETMMWSLLDYNTMSSVDPAADYVPVQFLSQEGQEFWQFDSTWYDMIEENSLMTGVIGHTQAAVIGINNNGCNLDS